MKLLIAIGIVVVATIHGYGAAWLAIWMLFHPYKSVKGLGLTLWPQGMIPRHREKLVQSIGNAVGNELVSQQTVFDALFETDFFQRKVEDFFGSYTNELLSRVSPSFIDALPSQARAPILDTISALQYRLAEYIADMLKSEETSEAIETFIDKQVDELLERRVGDIVKDESVDRVLNFVEQHLQRLTATEGFESKVHEFVSKRVEEYWVGPALEQEADSFLNATVDNVMARPLDELSGQFDAIRFEDLKSQISNRLIEILRSEALSTSLSIQVTDAIDRLRPQTLGADRKS